MCACVLQSGQHEARIEKASGFSVGYSAAALRELFILQLLHRDAMRRKGCPYILTPLAIVRAKVRRTSHPTPHMGRT